jgi:Ca2+:H+ antiporter
LSRVESENLDFKEQKRRAHEKKILVGAQLSAVFLRSWVNVFLLFVPVGFALYYSHNVSPVPIFFVNFIAPIPLAALLSCTTEEIAIRGDL